MTSKVNINKNKLLTELCLKQRKKADKKYFLELNDLIRLLKNIDLSIFNKTECVLWKGYLTKCNNNKSCYVNFYLKKRKLALHRILYINFIDDLNDKHYLKFTCANPGKCCNINHILKVCEDDNQDDKDQIPTTTQPTNNIPLQQTEQNIPTANLQVDITDENNIVNDINPSSQESSPSKKNISSNIKITKVDSNSKVGKIVIIFDD
jgi:hypothetical protein